MNPAPNHFNQLLEQYIFKIAHHHIDSADPETQPGIVDLWRTVSSTVEPETLPSASSTAQPTEWAVVLQKPVDWCSVDRQWIQGLIRERCRRHANYLSYLKQAVATTAFHLQALQTSQLSEQLLDKLIAHYQRTLLMYQQQLVQAERIRALYPACFTTDKP